MENSQEVDQKTEALQGEISQIALVNEITNDQELEQAIELLGNIKAKFKEVEAARKELTKPLLDHKKTIDNKFKKIQQPLSENEKKLKVVILNYRQKKEAEALRQLQERQEQQRLLAEAEKQRQEESEERGVETMAPIAVPVVQAPVAAPTTIISDSASASFKKVWTYEIQDPRQIPMNYWMINEKEIKTAIRSGIREIPGIRIYQEDSLAIR